eukprot:gene28730-31906_t
MPGCFPSCFSGGLVPEQYLDLCRAELKTLYEKSIALNCGRLIVHDSRNNNKRVYPKHILKREVTKFKHEHILKGTALGELDHPNYSSRYFKSLNLPNTSHQVLDVKWKDDQLWGTIEILPTPSGMLLWELYAQGIRLGVSSRGWASLRTDSKLGCVFVDDDFELITFDFVTEPSIKDAYLVPLRKQYKRYIPDQKNCVKMAHMGHGVVPMSQVSRLPDLSVWVTRLNQLQAVGVVPMSQVSRLPDLSVWVTRLNKLQAVNALESGSQKPAAAITNGSTYRREYPHRGRGTPALDKMILHSHYIVFLEASYLDREDHARDYSVHLANFAMRAHVADQQHLANSEHLNGALMQGGIPESTSPAMASTMTANLASSFQVGCSKAAPPIASTMAADPADSIKDSHATPPVASTMATDLAGSNRDFSCHATPPASGTVTTDLAGFQHHGR